MKLPITSILGHTLSLHIHVTQDQVLNHLTWTLYIINWDLIGEPLIILLWTMNSFNIMVLMVWSQRRCAMLLWFAVPYLKDASCIQGVYAQFSCERNSLTVTLNSQLNYVPGYLFLRARYLLVLDLSHAGFKMLPSYVWELIHLRHLDLSYNPIQTLSGLIINLFHLQTLKLICCFQLTSFPDNLHLLSNLCHLFISPSIPIVMPTFIDRLTCLQTLSNFTVLKKDGYQIEELKNLMTFMENLASKSRKCEIFGRGWECKVASQGRHS